jgi:hypothetical protein
MAADVDAIPFIRKNGVTKEISIVSSKLNSRKDEFKNVIHKTIGDNDQFEFIGKGSSSIDLDLYFETQVDYESFIDFVEGGAAFLLSCPFFPVEEVSILGGITTKNYYKGFAVASLTLTNAKNIRIDALRAGFEIGTESPIISVDKISNLKKLQDFGKNTFAFVGNTNQKIGKITNTFGAYSSALSNAIQGVASGTTIITNPISSVKSSVSRVLGSVNSAITSIQNAINVVKSLPSDIDSFVEELSAIGDKFNNLFDSGEIIRDLKQNSDALVQSAISIIESETDQNSPDIKDFGENSPNEPSNSPEFFLTSIQDPNKDVFDIMLLSSFLFSLYDNVENADEWNTLDLDALRKQTEIIYNFIISKSVITPDFKLQLDLARNNFFRLFKISFNNANQIVDFKVYTPTFLEDIVYSVNGNLDFLDETKKLNNLVGNIVEEDIKVILNA